MFSRLWRLLAPYHRDFYILVLISTVNEAAGIAVSYTVPLIVNLFAFQVQITVWFLVVIGMLSFNESYMRTDNRFDWHVITKIWHPIYKFLKLDAVAKFLRMPLVWHQRHNSGALIGQVSDGVWKTLDIIGVAVWDFLGTMSQMLLSLIPILFYSPLVALLCLLAFCLFVWLTLLGEEKKKALRKARQDAYEKDWNLSVSAVQAIETVITCGLQEYMLKRIEGVQDEIISLAVKENHIAVFTFNRWRIRALTTIRLLIYGLWVVQLYQGTIDIATLIFLSVLMERLLSSFWRFARLADRVYGNSEAVLRLINLLEEPETKEGGHQFVKIEGPVSINFEKVCLTYQDTYSRENGALHNLSLSFEAGKVTALVGPSGAGKSTVIAALMKLFVIHQGKIEVAGLDIEDWDSRKLLEQIAHVPPGDKVYLFDESVAFNIEIARPGTSREKIISAAEQVGLHDFIMGLEKDYDTVIGERGVRLSSGQKQRLALARAVLRESPIVILDEPTSAVDSLTEHLLQGNLKKMLVGKTAIIIAHRLSTIRDADRIFVLENGSKTEEGTHQELVALGGLYAKMVALQTSSERLD